MPVKRTYLQPFSMYDFCFDVAVYIFEQYGYCRGCGYELDIKGGE